MMIERRDSMNVRTLKKKVKRLEAKSKLLVNRNKTVEIIEETSARRKLEEAWKKKDLNICGNNIVDPQYDLMIIVPAHNVEKYIEACLDSIINQKTKYSYVVNVIENASDDNTKCKIEKYKKHDNVIYESIESRGLSVARNYALKHITGRYLMFVDSDDILPENAIDVLLDKAFEYDADVVEGNVETFDDSGAIVKRTAFAESLDCEDVAHSMLGQAWAKVIRSEIFKELVFPEGYIYEDSIISYCINQVYEKKYHVSDIVYKYRYNTQGICVSNRGNNKAIDTYWITEYFWEYVLARKEMDDSLFDLFLDQVSVNQKRIEELEQDIQKSVFSLMVYYFDKLNYQPKKLSAKKKQLYDSIMNRQYDMYRILCRYWDVL